MEWYAGLHKEKTAYMNDILEKEHQNYELNIERIYSKMQTAYLHIIL